MDRSKKQSARTLVFGGLLPIIAFTVVEETMGILWGVVAGMVFALGEISFEWFRHRKVETITWMASAMILILGGISLFTQKGLWFKLQPAILEAVMAVILFGSLIIKKPLLTSLAKKQNTLANFPPDLHEFLSGAFAGITFRLGIFFVLHTGLAIYAAFYWSTRHWALLKGVGFTISMIVYMLIEVFFLRKKIQYRMQQRQAK